MFVGKTRSIRWLLLALFLIVSIILFSVHFDKRLSEGFRHYAKDTTNETSTIPTKQLVAEEPHVQVPVLNLTRVEELSETYDIAITPPSLNWTEQDLMFFKTAAGETVFSQLALIPEASEKPDFAAMTSAERLFKALYLYFNQLIAQGEDPLTVDPESWSYYQRLERSLYPWLYPYWENAFHINNQTEGKGIVFCVGNNQFKFAATSIRTLREVLNCTLPIEVFYIREEDLSLDRRTYLRTEFNDIRIKMLESYVGYYYTRFGGWAMKPFAMLASSFTEVLMMDADVFFLQKPDRLFDDEGYKTTGSLFFYDRTLFPDWEKGPNWIRSFLPTMSNLVPKSRWFREVSSHEQESGVVVMDKRKVLLGLLSTCKLNGITERDQVVYKHMHGDKETFWIGFEIMQTPYTFIKSYGAVIGGMGRGGSDGDPSRVCGVHLHLDTYGKPLWLNGGLYRNKYVQPLEYMSFTHFAEGEDWDFQTFCIRETDKIRPIAPEQRRIALAAIEIDKQRVKDEELIESGQWKPKTLSS
ncbi:putative alpha-1,3-mannosyltransferase MNN1 [Choanephora cucurbitarum]|uniref:Putative alpha-1,3-mannosyltransferase MNN1 n=1 Tax=Choanephora cucurbitarum TaxID=101091 RepID=A0A1C7NE48_9FUNG|nr:putative alpha-1,3-mannosyltransferase MNN1 [Choanephora cucurbitarum]